VIRDALQAVLDRAPDTLDIRLDEIGQFPSARANPASQLSERQWDAIEAALGWSTPTSHVGRHTRRLPRCWIVRQPPPAATSGKPKPNSSTP